MKFVRRLSIFVFLALAAATAAPAAGTDYGRISSAVAQMLEESHYSRHPLDALLSRQFLDDYLDELDADHLFFTRQDIDAIVTAHAATLGKEAREGKLESAFEIFDLYRKRAGERVEKIAALLATGVFDFTGNRTVEISRAHAPWPESEAEADQLWRDRIVGELLDEKLDGGTLAKSIRIVRERYAHFGGDLRQETRRDEMTTFLSALARAYDPHSDYLRKQDLDDLDSDMRLSMEGIGVVLEPDGQYVRIVSLLPDSPAGNDGRLKAGDRIVAIAKGEGDFVDIDGMNFDRVVSLIRVNRGTRIRLKIITGRGNPSQRETIGLVSRKIELTDEEAKAEIIERKSGDGRIERLGWIKLPSFYGDPDHPSDRSLTRDVRTLVKRLRRENVHGIALDLRNNPGGELEEAVGVAGLFLGKLPIVQERDADGKVYISKSCEPAAYRGPLVVLTDHLTASAAELFACALQDYGRAVIVGGQASTYGKGSVQTVVDLSEVLKSGARKHEDLGALQLTIAKFYRVNGKAVQLRGLAADIHLVSPEDLPDEGESTMKHPLDYDETKPLAMATTVPAHPLPIAGLRENSAARIAAEPEFRYLADDLERARKKLETNRVSLNESVRRAELAEEKAREKQREDGRAQRKLPAENVARLSSADLRSRHRVLADRKSGAHSAVGGKPHSSAIPDAVEEDRPDAIRSETLNILSDLVRLSQTAHIAGSAK